MAPTLLLRRPFNSSFSGNPSGISITHARICFPPTPSGATVQDNGLFRNLFFWVALRDSELIEERAMAAKKSASEWDLEAFLRPHDGLNFEEREGFGLNRNSAGDLINCLSWSQNHDPKHPAGVGSEIKSSAFESPTSSQKVKFPDILGPLISSGSEQSDDESLDVDAGSCEQNADVVDLKRMRRKVSNRESARRSRKRKQAQLADLELQVDQLRGENASLYKQLMEASQHLTDAATDNRVLKSDVETLRVKVKMAEDLVTRGSLAFTLNSLLPPPAAAPAPQLPAGRPPCRAADLVYDFSTRSMSGHSHPLVRTSSFDQRPRVNGDAGECGVDAWQWAPDGTDEPT